MTRIHNRLTAKQVKEAKGPALINDGGGLHLQVSQTGSRSWIFRYRWEGKRPQLGLGSYPAVSLANARRKAEEARGYLNERPKRNPRDVWDAMSGKDKDSQTFGQFTESFLADILGGFKNEKHRYQWGQSLRTYAAPIWKTDIAAVDTAGVLACLKPIWAEKHETAKRLRGRIERILDAAKAQGLREGENPALWRGHLSAILPTLKLKTEHHAALAYDDVPALMARLCENQSLAAITLRFLILTGARSAEARGALWSEINIESKRWVLPPNRMKGEAEHIVPLCAPALDILAAMQTTRLNKYVFPGQSPGKPISETAIRALLKRLDIPPVKVNGRNGEVKMKPITQHGFRSTMRDWAGDRTTFTREVAEAALAHSVGNKVEQAYRRGSALEKRRDLINAWGKFCMGGDGADVVKLHG